MYNSINHHERSAHAISDYADTLQKGASKKVKREFLQKSRHYGQDLLIDVLGF